MSFLKELIKNLKFLWKYLKDEKLRLIGFFACNIINVIMSVILPIISAKVIVSLTNNQLFQLFVMAIVICLCENVRTFVHYLFQYFSDIIFRETFTKMQLDLGKHILKIKNSVIDEKSSGVFIERMNSDTSKMADVINNINYYSSDILTNIGIFIALFVINVKVFLFLFSMVLIIGFFEQKRIIKKNENDKIFRKEKEKISGFVGELVRGVRDIKMLSAEDSFLTELKGRLVHANNSKYKLSKVDRNYRLLIGFLHDIYDLLLICLLVYLIFIGELTSAVALVVYNYSTRVSYVMNSFSYLMEILKDFNLSSERVYNIIYGKEFAKEKFGKKSLKKVNGDFEFRNVKFGYNDNKLLFENLSFKVKANSTVAFVGKSGEGKSTIFNLLCKMYDIKGGNIYIDGEDISFLNKNSIRNNITIISQNPYIFNLSIRDNLRLVKNDLTDEEMVEVCCIACLDEFINALPDKYDTIVGEGGISLSGGQRQRLAIARALVQKTEIILFDEATSALDNVTQANIQKAIENLHGEYTVLIIAHRLSTIINCDRILFLNNGVIECEGSHEELLKKSVEYKKLYETEMRKR